MNESYENNLITGIYNMPSLITYVFDASGVLPDNRIVNEVHNVSGLGLTNAFLFVPNAAPFYGDSLTIVTSGGVTLTENVDYYLTHYWAQAANTIGSPIYGSISMLSTNPNGSYRINYQTIGGEYVANQANAIADGIIASANEFTLVDWSAFPTSFPPTPHSLNTNAIAQYPLICESIIYLASAVRQKQSNVSVNDIEGFVGLWANSTMIPLLELITAVNSNNDVICSSLLDLSSKFADTIKPTGLQHYEYKFGNFRVKFGYYVFTTANIPNAILFGGDNYDQDCIMSMAWVTPYDTGELPTNDTITWGAPLLNKMAVKVNLDTTYSGKRRIGYLTIGS